MKDLTIYGAASLEALRLACITGIIDCDLAAKAIALLPYQAIYLFLFTLLDGELKVFDPAHTTARDALPFAEWWSNFGVEISARHYPPEAPVNAA